MEYLQIVDFIKQNIEIVLALSISVGVTFIVCNKFVSKNKKIAKASKGGVAIIGNDNEVKK